MTSSSIHGSIAPLRTPVRRADTVWLEEVARELLSHPPDAALSAGIVQWYLDTSSSPTSRRTLASALDLFAFTASGDRCPATELAHRAALACGLDLVERAGLLLLDTQQEPVVGPRQDRWKEQTSGADGSVPRCGTF